MEPAIQRLVSLARKEVGVKEIGGNNRGPRIREYQTSTWLKPGAWPWCAAFTAWLLREWIEDVEVRSRLGLVDFRAAEKWRCRDASAFGWETWAKKHNYAVLAETELAKAGDLVTFDFSHIGVIVEDQPDLTVAIHTIEGNVRATGTTRDSSGGDGVAERRRDPGLVRGYIRLL